MEAKVFYIIYNHAEDEHIHKGSFNPLEQMLTPGREYFRAFETLEQAQAFHLETFGFEWIEEEIEI